MLLYSALLLLVLVVGAPYWLLRMVGSGRYRAGLPGRLGRVPAELREAVRGREVVWLHAVSVGEVMAAVEVVRGLAAARPGLVVAVSTTTATGQALAKRRMEGMPVFYLPLDFGWLVRRYLRVLRPRMLVLMESELWPNLLRGCGRVGVPVAVVNARVSDRSYPRYLRLRRLWRPLMERVAVFLAQGEETAERLRAIGVDAERVRVVGNLKYDVRAVAEGGMLERLRARLPDGAKVVVCGSTLEGEEAMLLGAWPGVVAEEPRAVMVLAPRHPERFGRVVAMVEAAGFRGWRASELGRGESFGGEEEPMSQKRDMGHPTMGHPGFGALGGDGGEDRPMSQKRDMRHPTMGYQEFGALGGDGGEEGPMSQKRDPSASSGQAVGHPGIADGVGVGFGEVVVLDTIGDLGAVYSLASVAFVGGSLVTAGGHNPLEPARFGVPVVIGSNFDNFREVVESMRERDGIRVVTSDEMPVVLRDLLRDGAGARALGDRGQAVFAGQAGATERTVEALLRVLGR